MLLKLDKTKISESIKSKVYTITLSVTNQPYME